MLTLSTLETRINEVYTMATLCKYTADTLCEQLTVRVYNELNRRYKSYSGKQGRLVYSNYMRGYAFGLITAKNTYIMQNLVEFCYLYEGKLYTTHRQSAHPYWADSLDGKTISRCKGNFYWKGTDKPYTVQ